MNGPSDSGPRIDAGVDGGARIDGGSDAGHDAGFVSGIDAGFDAGFDGGLDAGPDDAGLDAAPSDSGIDAPTCVPAGWGSPVTYVFGPPLSSHSTWVTTGDFDSDGDMDFAATGAQDYLVYIYLNHGDGTFANGITFSSGPWPEQMVAVDLDRDGHLDLAIANVSAPCGSACCSGGFGCNSAVAVLHGHGDGTFDSPMFMTTSGFDPTDIAAGDIDHDHDIDIVTVNTNPAGNVATFFNRGDGTFAPVNLTPAPGASTVALGDLDGDGTPEVIVGAIPTTGTMLYTFRASGGALLARAEYPYSLARVHGGVPEMTAADFDGSGRAGVALMGGIVFHNDGSGGLLAPIDYNLPSGYGRPVTADIDRDGLNDIVQPMQFLGGMVIPEFVGIAHNDGQGVFTMPPIMVNEFSLVDLAVAELNGDGVPDFVVGNTGWVSVVLSHCM